MSCRTSQNVISNGRPLVRTLALLIQGDLCPRHTLLCPHNPDRLGRSLMWVPLMVFFPPRTTLVLGLGLRRSILMYSSQIWLHMLFLIFIVFLSWISDPLSMVGLFLYIVPLKWSWPSTCWSPNPYLSICPIRHLFLPLLCVGGANVVLFRGLLHINTTRTLAAKPLMRWLQLSP